MSSLNILRYDLLIVKRDVQIADLLVELADNLPEAGKQLPFLGRCPNTSHEPCQCRLAIIEDVHDGLRFVLSDHCDCDFPHIHLLCAGPGQARPGYRFEAVILGQKRARGKG
jgi:hypothetical protein